MTHSPFILQQQEKAKQFYNLHHSGKLLVLPNIWDCLGAQLLENLEYPAVATASASVAYTNGYDDGENISFNDLLVLLQKISKAVNIPVTADIESGYAGNDIELKENIKQLLEAGIVGINIEDSDTKTKSLVPIEIQCHRLKLIKEASTEMNIPIFINARTDTYIHADDFESPAAVLEETIRRGAAYKAAGAECFFPLAVQRETEIKSIVEQLQMPLNILLMPGVPELNMLQEMNVARVSLGPGFLKIAVRAMKSLALKLKSLEGLTDITGNEITSGYLKNLVEKK